MAATYITAQPYTQPYSGHVTSHYSSPLQVYAAPTKQFATPTIQTAMASPQWSPQQYSRDRPTQPYTEDVPAHWTNGPSAYSRTASPHRPQRPYRDSTQLSNAVQPYRRTSSPQAYREPYRPPQQGVHDISRNDIVGFLEIGEVADLPSPRPRTHTAILVTIESSANPNAFIDTIGPLALSLQTASEFFHTDGQVQPKELLPNPQQLSGNLRNQSRQPEQLQVMSIRLRVHFCPPNLNIDYRDGLRELNFVGVTDNIAVSWHSDRKVYDLKTPVGSTIGHIYVAHRLCFSTDIERSLEDQNDDGPVTEIEWGTKKVTKLQVFSRRYVMQLSLQELSDNAQRVYKAIQSDPLFGERNVPNWRSKALSRPTHHYDELIQWTLQVQQDYLNPVLKVTGRTKPTHRIRIQIKSAKGVKVANTGTFGDGSSDPYVIAEIEGRKESKYKTKVIQSNLNPVWNEEYETDCCIGVDELQFTLKDSAEGVMERMGGAQDQVLGIAKIPSKKITEQGFEQELTIYDKETRKPAGMLRVAVSILKTLAGAAGRKGSKEITRSDYHSGSRRMSKDLANADYYSSGGSPDMSRGSPEMSPRNTMLQDWHHNSPQNHVHANAPMQNHGGNATLKICIHGLRNLAGGAGMQASGGGTCLCEIRGSPNSRHEARLGTQASHIDMHGYAGNGALDFFVFNNQRELLGTGSLLAVQFFPRGYDAEMTLTCQKRGITGLLRVKIVVIGAQTSGNQSYHASPGQHFSQNLPPGGYQPSSPNFSQGGHSNFRQNGQSRKIGIMGQSEIETIERNSQSYGNDPMGKNSEFMGRHLSMAEGRHPTMVDTRESFAMSDARQSFNDRRGSFRPQMSERYDSPTNMQSSYRDTRQHRGADSFMDIGPSSSAYEGDSHHASRRKKDPYDEQQQAFAPTRSENDVKRTNSGSLLDRGLGLLGSVKGALDRSASFLSNSSARQEKGNADGGRNSPRSMLGGGGSRSRDFDQVGSYGGGDRAVITVHIISASSLRKADFMGLSDPYCKVRIPGKPTTEFQTIEIKQDLNPVWNAKFEITDYETTDSLEFELWDWDQFTAHDFLGKATLDPASHPFGFLGFDGELLLEDAGDATGKAKLKLRVESSLQEPL